MLTTLPLEIQVKILTIDPSSSLKYVNSHFYILYNDLFHDKIIATFGEDINFILIKVLPWLKRYIKSLDVFRFKARHSIASRLGLTDTSEIDDSEGINRLNCLYVKDSWKYIYSILKNKRLYAEYSDYTIDEPTNYVYNHFVEINRTYLLSYSKTLWLSPGRYNLNIGLIIKHGSGLGTTKFEIKYKDATGKDVIQTFYPPTNINEILPKQQFCLLKIGEFSLPEVFSLHRGTIDHEKLFKVEFVMEEIGLYLKSGFRIFFIDIAQPSLLFNDYDLLYYTVKETDYKYFINLPLKNLYKALNIVQNGEHDDGILGYGHGDPSSDLSKYDNDYLIPGKEANLVEKITGEAKLMEYSNFFFNNRFKKRLFKFNTVYQQRQFINRFGDFKQDWDEYPEKDKEELLNDARFGRVQPQKSCSYDRQGLKWKIPILGEL
ncbi:uncharacterized protein CANTADRAFT_53033 [Suhomyces tanzawaensis NRRL Y-17324]|uniref:Uncharacterized protein n=1 Tax=Suhomyces tanzawaensis NRRL Y-17324 TaxID=984487 RepID=A0A1E4SFF1_9ASCO|nr:uncharacterized protein CANTADRAFT_53033 [Suhomyces tanzawaensis NRRL Y-17324]ODV78233.1 hypothetical protein CANTADRAFT_53033 [Suhomyces tanzawaensis NRRL Y-17324]